MLLTTLLIGIFGAVGEFVTKTGAAYFLAPHIFAARVESAVILLDSKSDDYILIEPELAPGFLAMLRRGGLRAAGDCPSSPAGLADLIGELESRGSITPAAQEGKPFELLELIPNSLELPGPRIDAIPRISSGHVAAMVLALIKTAYLLRIRGLRSAIRHVLHLKATHSSRDSRHDPSDLVEIYHRVRPFFYSAKNKCLFNSLSMIIFLSRYGVVPDWWFGVKLKPFEAHCWVEDERWLYNDQYARTWRYTPIMRV
jgi:Transglutaminase-like superfamily